MRVLGWIGLVLLATVASSAEVPGSAGQRPPASGAEQRSLLSLVWSVEQARPVRDVRFSPDGRMIAAANQDGTVRLVDASSGKTLRTLSGHRDRANGLAFSPDGRLLASASADRTVRLWNPATGAPIRTLTGHTDKARCAAFSPDGTLLATGGEDRTVRLWDVRTGALRRTLPGHLSGVMGVAFSPDGKTLASCDGLMDQNGEIRLWNVATGAAVRSLQGHTGEVWAVRFSPDGRTLASTGSDYTVKLWDARTGRLLRSLREGGHMTSLAFSPDGRLLALGTFTVEGSRLSGGEVHVRSVATGRLHARLEGLKGPVISVAFSRDGSRLAAGGGYEAGEDRRPGELKVWDTRGFSARVAERERTPELALKIGHHAYVDSVAYSPDGRRIASAGWGTPGEIKIWQAGSGELERTIVAAPAPVLALRWSPDGARLAAGTWNGEVQLWDPDTGDLIFSRKLYTGPMYGAAFAPDGKALATAGGDQIVRLWDPATGSLKRALPAAGSPLHSIEYSPDGSLLVAAGEGGSVRLWSAATGEAVRTLAGHEGTVNQARFSPDGSTIATAGEDRTVRLWNARTGEPVRSMKGHPDAVSAVAFAPDGKTLASCSGGLDEPAPRGEVRLWNPETGEVRRRVATGVHLTAGLTFAPDGRTLAAGAGELDSGEVQLCDPSTGERRGILAGQPGQVTALAISPDAAQVAVAVGQTLEGSVKVWDLHSGLLSRSLSGDPGPIQELAFSPDGALLATGSWAQVRIRDTRSGQVVRTVAANNGTIALVQSVAFSPDGSLLASGTREKEGPGVIRLSDARNGNLVRTLAGHTGVVRSVAFSPDGTMLASSGEDRTIHLWDVRTGASLRALAGHIWTVTTVRFSPDGGRIAGISMDPKTGVGEVRIWNARTGELERTLSGQVVSGPLAFSPDGVHLAVAAVEFREEGTGHDVRLYEVSTGRLVRSMEGHIASITGLAFSRDGSRLITGGEDNTLRVWDPRSGRLLATLLTLPVQAAPAAAGARPLTVGAKELPLPDEYLAFTPEGYYAGSAAADRYVRFRLRGNQFPAESFQGRFYRPDLVKSALAGGALPPPPVLKGAYPPLVRFISPAASSRVTGAMLQVTLNAADDSAVREVALFVNGTRVEPRAITVGARPLTVGAREFPETHPGARTVTAALSLPPGEATVRVQAIAYDEDGLQSPREELLFTRDPAPAASGKLLGVSVGVSRYRDRSLDLRYAHQDALALAADLGRQRGIYSGAEITALTDEKATAPGVRAALDRLVERTSKADTVVLFLSGHGWRAEDGTFYFATHEVDRKAIPATALPWNDVVERLVRLSETSRRVIVLLDACHSGSAATNEELVKSLLRANAGVLVLASSKGSEVSLESEALQHGAFTKAVLEAIEGGAAPPGEKSITVLDFLSYVARRVRTLTGDAQHPHVPYLQDFDTDTALVATAG